MMKARQSVPAWYQADWRPVTGRGELPQMTWEDVETVLDNLASTPARKDAAQDLFRGLRVASAQLSPMDLLQQMLLCAATLAGPRAPRAMARVKPGRSGVRDLPRWSYTDLEVALAYSCSGQPLRIALERYRDLLSQRAPGLSGAEMMRSIFLIAFGLPPSERSRTKMRNTTAPTRRAA